MNQGHALAADAQPTKQRKPRRYMLGAMVLCCAVKLALILGVATIFT